MAKKKTVAPKKATASVRKTTASARKASPAKKKPTTAKKKTTAAKKKPSTARKTATAAKAAPKAAQTQAALSTELAAAPRDIQALSATHEKQIALLPPQFMDETLSRVNVLMEDFLHFSENNLTIAQRRRKIGAGIRNYGFIEKVADVAAANPQYAQFFNIIDLRNAIRNIDMCRDLVLALQAFTRAVSNTMLVYSDDAFTMSLIFYNMVREMSRRGDPVAMELFRTLQTFFRRPRRAAAEPTAKELERDIHSLLHGTKDGKIVIENQSPVVTKGARKVVDDVHKGKAMIRETAEAEVEN